MPKRKPEIARPIEDSKRVSPDSPTPDKKASKPATKKKPVAKPSPAPSSAFKSKGRAEPPCGPRCQAAQKRQQNDLIAQESMAASTAAVVIVAWAQFGLGAFGIVLLGITARYAYRAAVAAENTVTEARAGTTAAVRTADVAEESMIRLERPYLFPKILEIGFLQSPRNNMPFLKYAFTNHGRTPAIFRHVSVTLAGTPKLPLRLPLGGGKDVYEIIPPGDQTVERAAYVEDSAIGQPWAGEDMAKLVFYCGVEYEDTTGATHTDTFCLRGTANGNFVGEGGNEYNKRRTERPPQSKENGGE